MIFTYTSANRGVQWRAMGIAHLLMLNAGKACAATKQPSKSRQSKQRTQKLL